MENDIASINAELEQITEDVRGTFGTMSGEQLNWKPAADSWSIAQCLDHLILTNTEMFPAIDAKIEGARNSFWENYSPLTGFFGGFLAKSLRKDNKKYKAPSKNILPPSEIPADIVERFADNQTIVIEKIGRLGELDWDKTVLTSPFMGLMTYTINDGVDILVEHGKRHVRQAKRVMENDGFPGS